MFNRIIDEALRSAGIDPADFDRAILKAKFKNRTDWLLRAAPASLIQAYNDRVKGQEQ